MKDEKNNKIEERREKNMRQQVNARLRSSTGPLDKIMEGLEMCVKMRTVSVIRHQPVILCTSTIVYIELVPKRALVSSPLDLKGCSRVPLETIALAMWLV